MLQVKPVEVQVPQKNYTFFLEDYNYLLSLLIATSIYIRPTEKTEQTAYGPKI